MKPVARMSRGNKPVKIDIHPDGEPHKLMADRKYKSDAKARKAKEVIRVKKFRMEKKKDKVYQQDLKIKERERKRKQRLRMKEDPEEIQIIRKKIDSLRKKKQRMKGN